MFGYGFEELQISGLQPSLLANRLGLEVKTLHLLFFKIRLLPCGCWEWMGANRNGYGAVRIRALSPSVMQAHRICYELVHGKISTAAHLHHKVEKGCIGPRCCNPAHLEETDAADHTTNLTPKSMTFGYAHQTACKNGHPYTVESTHMTKSCVRHCRICDAARAKARRDAQRASTGRRKFARDPETYKEECKRGHSLMDESNIKWVDTPWGKQKQCRACIEARSQESRARFQKIMIGELPPLKPSHLQKDVCVNGHPMDPENTYIRPDGTGRACMKCRLASAKRSQAAHREEYLKGRRERRASIRSKVLEEFKARVVGIYASGVRGEELAQQLKEALPPTNLRPTKGIIQQAAWQKILEIYKMDIPDDELIQRLRDALPPAEQ